MIEGKNGKELDLNVGTVLGVGYLLPKNEIFFTMNGQ